MTDQSCLERFRMGLRHPQQGLVRKRALQVQDAIRVMLQPRRGRARPGKLEGQRLSKSFLPWCKGSHAGSEDLAGRVYPERNARTIP